MNVSKCQVVKSELSNNRGLMVLVGFSLALKFDLIPGSIVKKGGDKPFVPNLKRQHNNDNSSTSIFNTNLQPRSLNPGRLLDISSLFTYQALSLHKMMRGDDGNDMETGHAYPTGGARQRRNFSNNNGTQIYSSVPTADGPPQNMGYGPKSYSDGDSKKQYASFNASTLSSMQQPTNISSTVCCNLCQSTAHLTEGPNQPFYRDNFNDQPYSCNFGTEEENGIWMNTSDEAGTIMAFIVWILLAYSAWTFTLLARSGGIPPYIAAVYVMLCCMALASHAKTTFTDPGSVPQAAVPNEQMRREMGTPDQPLSMCSQCQTFKPPFSHHCRICNRCVSRMDHHCPWMNNW